MTFKKLIRGALALLLLVGIISISGCTEDTITGAYDSAMVKARTGIWQDINAGRSASGTIAVMDGSRIVYTEGFGMADREKSIAVDVNTLFNVGSVSKVYTATAVMLLVDQGSLKLDDPVIKYLPEFSMADPRYKEITVRMLLNHTSGLPGSTMGNNFGFVYNPEVFKETLENLVHSHLKYQPGSMTVYCNDGFTLAEMVIERVSGQKYLDFLSAKVFKPLSISNTGLGVGERPGKQAAAYYEVGSGKKEPLEISSTLGAGGLGATPSDLCRFARTFSPNGKALLSPSSQAEMRKVQPSATAGKLRNPYLSFGLGWDITSAPALQSQGIQVMGKSGGTPNYNTWLLTAPDQGISVAVVESGPTTSVLKIAYDVLNSILVQKGLVKSIETTISYPLQPESIPAEMNAFDGYYLNDGGAMERMAFDMQNNTVTTYEVINGVENPVSALFYHAGYCYDGGGNRSYFVNLEGANYYVSSSPLGDTIALQKLERINNPLTMQIDMQGKMWLRRNVSPSEGMTLSVYPYPTAHMVKSSLNAALPGYVDFSGIKRIESAVFAGMPGIPRDQTELTLMDKNGQTWAQNSEMLYSPAEAASILNSGENTVKIGSEGYNEWFTTAKDAILSFSLPAKDRVIVFAADGSSLYDSAVDSGEVFVKQGSYIELAGQIGDACKVTAR